MKTAEENTQKYWKKFLKEHDKLNINKKELSSKIKKIYNSNHNITRINYLLRLLNTLN